MTFSIITLSIKALRILTLDDECFNAECRILFIVMLVVVMPSVIVLIVLMLSVIVLIVLMLSVIMLSVVAPLCEYHQNGG